MLKNLSIQGFKSLRDTGPIELAPLTVFFGPNAVGKSNLLDAVVLLSRLATARTAAEALKGIRGQPLELFSFPAEGGGFRFCSNKTRRGAGCKRFSRRALHGSTTRSSWASRPRPGRSPCTTRP